MEKVLELRLTKTEYERLLRYALIGNFVETFDQKEPKISERRLLLMMMSVAYINGHDFVVKDFDGLAPSEKMIVKMEKALDRYARNEAARLADEENIGRKKTKHSGKGKP